LGENCGTVFACPRELTTAARSSSRLPARLERQMFPRSD
jgi:hypothetical protein